jgi:hypothetical protein
MISDCSGRYEFVADRVLVALKNLHHVLGINNTPGCLADLMEGYKHDVAVRDSYNNS